MLLCSMDMLDFIRNAKEHFREFSYFRMVPLRCTCIIKKIEMKKYLQLYHAKYHLPRSNLISYFTSKGHVQSNLILEDLFHEGQTEFNVCSIRNAKFNSPTKHEQNRTLRTQA